MVTHQSQLCTSVQIRTAGFSSISCSGRNGNKISCSFLGVFHLPSTSLGNRVWPPFAQGDIRLCPLPRLGKPPLTSLFLTGTFPLYLQPVTGWLFTFPNNHGFILLQLFIMTVSLKWEFKTLRLLGWNWREREKYRKPQNKINIQREFWCKNVHNATVILNCSYPTVVLLDFSALDVHFLRSSTLPVLDLVLFVFLANKSKMATIGKMPWISIPPPLLSLAYWWLSNYSLLPWWDA